MQTAPTPLPLGETMTTIVRGLDEALASDFSAPARLVYIQTDGEGFELGLKELPPGCHPVDELLGFVAPAEWTAFGVVSHGWASTLAGRSPSRAKDRRRIRAFHLAARDGTEVGGFRRQGDALALIAAADARGMVPDVVRRSMGLATPPPQRAVPPPHGSWDDLRWAVVSGELAVRGLSATEAAWMDAGMFSRWLLGA